MLPVDVTESAVTAFRVAVVPEDWVMFPATVKLLRFPTLVILVWATVASVPTIFPVDVTESAVRAFRVAVVPDDWLMFPATVRLVRLPTLVTLV